MTSTSTTECPKEASSASIATPWIRSLVRTVSKEANGVKPASRNISSSESVPFPPPRRLGSRRISSLRTASSPSTSVKTVRSPPDRFESAPIGSLSSHCPLGSACSLRKRSHVSVRVRSHCAVSQYSSEKRASPTSIGTPHSVTSRAPTRGCACGGCRRSPRGSGSSSFRWGPIRSGREASGRSSRRWRGRMRYARSLFVYYPSVSVGGKARTRSMRCCVTPA
mmetsp:Transcript_3059/g.9344  ORF Transcript_3059/g.9344 Transcript_3059/m.9344 type:complete len:223 (+) Transcript_3059:348-1016(+)